jgi:hypothetical protein
VGRWRKSGNLIKKGGEIKMKKLIVMLIISVVLLSLAVSCMAKTGDVWLAGYYLFNVRDGGPYTIQQRTDILQSRAVDLLSEGNKFSQIITKKFGNDVAIYTDGFLFVTVTEADAKANKTTTDKLAAIWIRRVQNLLPLAIPKRM